MKPRSAIKTDLFADEHHRKKLDSLGDPLADIELHIDFAALAAEVDRVAPRTVSAQGGRPPYPTETMVRILVLKRLYNLSDEQMEYQLLDRMSYKRFCGLANAANIPDRTTVWTFENRIGELGAKALFEGVSAQLLKRGFIARGGQIIDATLVPAPKQHNSRGEKALIDQGAMPADWKPAKRRQKDTDATWTKKHGKSHFGYKLSINVDKKYKFIRTLETDTASTHDSQHFDNVFDTSNTYQLQRFLQKERLKGLAFTLIRAKKEIDTCNELQNYTHLCNLLEMPVRKIPKNFRNVTGIAASSKAVGPAEFESTLERDFLALLDFSPDVARYEVQPVRIEWSDGTKKGASRYTPDVLVEFVPELQRRPWLCEVKYRADLAKEWATLHPKLRRGVRYAKQHGWRFRLITEVEVRTQRLTNIRFLAPFGRRSIPQEDIEAVLAAIAAERRSTPAAVLLALSPSVWRQAEYVPALWHLVARHQIGIDLEAEITMQSPIWSVS